MKRDLLDAFGKIDPRYIEEAAGLQQSAEGGNRRDPAPVDAQIREIRPDRRRSVWAVAAAALFLVLSVGTAWMLISKRSPGGLNPSNIPADTPIRTGESTLSGTEEPSEEVPPEETTAPPELQSIHELDLELEKLSGETDSEEVALACDYLTSRTPDAKNGMTGLFAGKNLILITAMNFAPEVIDPVRTPTLYRLATQGIEFTDYYQPAWGGGTPSGEFAILTGLVPANGVQSILDTAELDMDFTLGNQLQRLGYSSFAWCDDHSYDYLHRDLTYPNLGYTHLIGVGSGLEEFLTKQWPYSDQEMVDVGIRMSIDQKPFSISFLLCSGQGLYSRQTNAMSEKHWAEVEDLPYSDTVKAYLAANLEVEYALQDLVDALEDAGIADDTVIVLTSSQYPYALEENEDWGNTEDYLSELYGYEADDVFKRDHSSLIIWSGCLEGKDYKVTTPTSSLDILPTLSNLFGLEYDSRLFVGRDVFSDREPLVFWPDGSWKTDRYSYNAETRAYSSGDGSEIPYEDSIRLHETVKASVDYSAAVLKTDLFALLFPTEAGIQDYGWLYTPGPDPCEVVREAICRQVEKNYTISATVREARLDEGEKQLVLAGDLDCQLALRNGFGAEGTALMEQAPENLAAVYVRYEVVYDHSKTFYRDGDVDQYFYLIRGADGNWEIFASTYVGGVDSSEP